MRSAFTALARMPSPPWSSAYWRIRNSVAALGSRRDRSRSRIHRLLGRVEQQAAAQPWMRMMRTAFCATLWCAQKFSSKLSRRIASSTSPMRPCQAAPALETTMSTPP